MLDELGSAATGATVAIVGNELRVNLIVARATGARVRPLVRSEALSIAAETLQQYRRGGAVVEFRSGLKGEPEEILRDELHSKTAVATLLAGFTFTVLVELLIGGTLNDLQAFAEVLLTFSLGLPVACVYIYDQLALPPGFCSASERSVGADVGLRARLLRPLERAGHELRGRTSRRAENRRAGFVFAHAVSNHGAVYAYMVWIWQWNLYPAVIAGLAGFILLLVGSETTSLIIGGTVALGVAGIVYLSVGPRLGID